MRKLSYFLFVFSLCIFSVSILGFIFNGHPIQTNTFYTSVNVTNNIGFDLNSTALTFGNVVKGGSSSRNLNLVNNYPFPVVAIVRTEGEIAPLLHFDNIIDIGINESKKLSFSVLAYPYFNESLYTGNVFVELYRR